MKYTAITRHCQKQCWTCQGLHPRRHVPACGHICDLTVVDIKGIPASLPVQHDQLQERASLVTTSCFEKVVPALASNAAYPPFPCAIFVINSRLNRNDARP